MRFFLCLFFISCSFSPQIKCTQFKSKFDNNEITSSQNFNIENYKYSTNIGVKKVFLIGFIFILSLCLFQNFECLYNALRINTNSLYLKIDDLTSNYDIENNTYLNKYKILVHYHIPKTAGMTITSTLNSFLNVKLCKTEGVCRDSNNWKNIDSKNLISLFKKAKKDENHCNLISIEFLRNQGQYIQLNSHNDTIYQFTFMRQPLQHTISSIVHDIWMKRFQNFNLNEVVDFKLNKSKFLTRDNSGYSLYNGNFQTNRLVNKLDLKTFNNFSYNQNQIDGCKNNFYLDNKINIEDIKKIKKYIDKVFNFVGIFEYFHESFCLFLFDVFAKNLFIRLEFQDIINFCSITCEDRNDYKKTKIFHHHNSYKDSLNILKTNFISPENIKRIHSINKIDYVVYSYFLSQLLDKIDKTEKKFNISIIC